MADLFKPPKHQREQNEREARELIREQRERQRARVSEKETAADSKGLWFRVKRILMLKL